MGRLHCPTCTCGDDREPLHIDATAPFYPLVALIDRLSLREQRQRYRQTLAERQTRGEPVT